MKVANPADVVLFKKNIKRIKHSYNGVDKDAMNNAFEKMVSYCGKC